MSKTSSKTLIKLRELKMKNSKLIKEKDIWLLNYIEEHPIIDATITSKDILKSYSSINRTILRFVELGILNTNDNANKSRSYSYTEYINILKFDI